MSTPLRCVLFDLDDVLVDYQRDERVRHLAQAIGRTPGAVRAAIYESGIEEAGDSGTLDAVAYLRALGAQLRCTVSADAWTDARRAATRLRPDVWAMAQAAGRRLELGLLTNNGVLMAERLSDIVPELFPLFAGRAFASAQFGARKPDPQVYLACLAHLGVTAASTLFVDDNIDNVAGARQAGLQVHHFQNTAGLQHALTAAGAL